MRQTSERVQRMTREQETHAAQLHAAAGIVKRLLADNASPFATEYGTLSRLRVWALRVLLRDAGFPT